MKSEFSESTFGFILGKELECELNGLGNSICSPLLPSLQDEADLGFDLKLTYKFIVLYLQFKTSHYLTHRNAAQSSHMTLPFYRFDVKTCKTANGRAQHNTLVDLETRSPKGTLVRYAAPLFHSQSRLDSLYMSGSVKDESVFPAPSLLGEVRVDCEKHVYAMTSAKDVRAFSNPTEPMECGIEALVTEILETRNGLTSIQFSEFLETQFEVLSPLLTTLTGRGKTGMDEGGGESGHEVESYHLPSGGAGDFLEFRLAPVPGVTGKPSNVPDQFAEQDDRASEEFRMQERVSEQARDIHRLARAAARADLTPIVIAFPD